jgi:predicted dinucleotide-binding enzyme
MNITVIGSGVVGRAVAAGFASHGHHVTLSSRSPEQLADWSSETGIAVLPPEESLAQAELVVNATPGAASIDALAGAGLIGAGGLVVLDLSNPLEFSAGVPRLSTGVDESVAEAIQSAFPETRVVKTLNTLNNAIMTNPGLLAEPSLQFVCGNDAGAKGIVIELLTDVGWQADQILDLGDLTGARETERYLMLWLRIMGATGTGTFNIRLVRD